MKIPELIIRHTCQCGFAFIVTRLLQAGKRLSDLPVKTVLVNRLDHGDIIFGLDPGVNRIG